MRRDKDLYPGLVEQAFGEGGEMASDIGQVYGLFWFGEQGKVKIEAHF